MLWQFSLQDGNFGLSFSMVPFPKKLCLSGNNCKSFPRKWKKVEQKLVLCALYHKNLEVFNSLVQIKLFLTWSCSLLLEEVNCWIPYLRCILSLVKKSNFFLWPVINWQKKIDRNKNEKSHLLYEFSSQKIFLISFYHVFQSL